MSENSRNWIWDEASEKAAYLLAEDELTDREIAEECGIDQRTLTRWKHEQVFRDRIEANAHDLAAHTRKHAIARRNRRIAELQKEWADLEEQRQGLLKALAAEEDVGTRLRLLNALRQLTKERRELAKQAGIELGQWSEKREVVQKRDPDEVRHMTTEEIEQELREERRRGHEKGKPAD